MATWKLVKKALREATPVQLIRVRSFLVNYRDKNDYSRMSDEYQFYLKYGKGLDYVRAMGKNLEKAKKAIEAFDKELYFRHEIAEILNDDHLSKTLNN